MLVVLLDMEQKAMSSEVVQVKPALETSQRAYVQEEGQVVSHDLH